MQAAIEEHGFSNKSPRDRWEIAARRLQLIFEEAGWKVKAIARDGARGDGDFRASRRKINYAVELKAAAEGRGDRLVPLFAQAALQLMRRRDDAWPLAVVNAPAISSRVAGKVLDFADRYAPDVAVGLFDFEGFRLFRGRELAALNAEPGTVSSRARLSSGHSSRSLFSDLNQWMLKVLLAPELPDRLLSAPRSQYANASQLARAAQVSVMSAFRFIRQLQDEGYLHESSSSLALVRREDLFPRWQAASDRPVKEIPMRFRLPGNADIELAKIAGGGRACLALFAAADALKLGFVQGVPPHVYVPRLRPSIVAAWKNLRPCEPGEPPDLLMRQPSVVESVFRGMVRSGGVAASDVIQIWLDVAAHPARGREQADLIRRHVLDPIINKSV